MSSYDHHNQPQVAYAPPSTEAGQYVAPLPPVGYPTKDGPGQAFAYSQNSPPPVQTKSSGERECACKCFWKACCAALCCCCVLDSSCHAY